MAENKNEGSLGFKFWNKGEWKKTYRYQITLANRLIKKFDEQDLIQALNSKAGKSIYSLRNNRITGLVARAKKTPLSDTPNILPTSDTLSKPKKPFGNKNKLTDLRKLDE
jgi:hypothetical protein